jgi:hypothetical protein
VPIFLVTKKNNFILTNCVKDKKRKKKNGTIM